MQISQAKKHRQDQSAKKLATSIGSKLKVKNMTTPCNSGTDLKAKQHLRRAFVMEMPTSVTDATIQVEHALVDMVALIKSAITLFYTTQELESHWYWFYSAKEQKFKYNFIEPSTFFDSTPMGKDGDACTGLYFRIINAASVIHKPEFNFILYLLKTNETSALSIQCLGIQSQYLTRLFRGGTTLTRAGFYEERTRPKKLLASSTARTA